MASPNNSLVIVRGLPGSGKTTYAKSAFPDHVYLDADSFHIINGQYIFQQQNAHKAHIACRDLARSHLIKGDDVVVANTFLTVNDVNEFIDAMSLPLQVRVYSLFGKFKSIHHVPEYKIANMRKQWQVYPSSIHIHPSSNILSSSTSNKSTTFTRREFLHYAKLEKEKQCDTFNSTGTAKVGKRGASYQPLNPLNHMQKMLGVHGIINDDDDVAPLINILEVEDSDVFLDITYKDTSKAKCLESLVLVLSVPEVMTAIFSSDEDRATNVFSLIEKRRKFHNAQAQHSSRTMKKTLPSSSSSSSSDDVPLDTGDEEPTLESSSQFAVIHDNINLMRQELDSLKSHAKSRESLDVGAQLTSIHNDINFLKSNVNSSRAMAIAEFHNAFAKFMNSI